MPRTLRVLLLLGGALSGLQCSQERELKKHIWKHIVTSDGRNIYSYGPEDSNKAKSNETLKCDYPMLNEDLTKVFSSCKPQGQDSFPASKATCKYSKCHGHVTTTCMSGPEWSVKIPDSCYDPKYDVKCFENSTSETDPTGVRGSMIAVGNVTNVICKQTCKSRKLRCYNNRELYSDKNESCTAIDDFKRPHLNSSFSRNTYTFWCSAGYRLNGRSEVHCVDGAYQPKLPSCVAEEHGPTAGDDTQKGGYVIGPLEISLMVVAVVLTLVIFALLGVIYRMHREDVRREQQGEAKMGLVGPANEYMANNDMYVPTGK